MWFMTSAKPSLSADFSCFMACSKTCACCPSPFCAQVFSAGFAAAILGKRSSSTRGGGVVLAGEVPGAVAGPGTVTSDVGAGKGAGTQPGRGEQSSDGVGGLGEAGGRSTEGVPAPSAEEVDAMLIRVGDKAKGPAGEGGPDGERAAADAQHIGSLEWTLRACLTRFFGVVLEVPSVKR